MLCTGAVDLGDVVRDRGSDQCRWACVPSGHQAKARDQLTVFSVQDSRWHIATG